MTRRIPLTWAEECIALLNRQHREPSPGPWHISVLIHAGPAPDRTETS